MGPSFLHLLILTLVLLLLFGPNTLRQVGRSIGQAIRGFKKGLSEPTEIDVTYSVESPSIDESPESLHPPANHRPAEENPSRSESHISPPKKPR